MEENRKQKLLAEQKEILAQLKKLEGVPDMGNDVESTFDEEADEAEELHKNLGMREDLKKRLVEIKSELDNLHKKGL